VVDQGPPARQYFGDAFNAYATLGYAFGTYTVSDGKRDTYAVEGDNAGPRITLAQYARAHQIAESWRLNAWRFVELMDHAQGGDDREQRLVTILHTLAATNTPATERELHRRSHWDRAKVEAVLRQLEKDGLVVSRPTKTKRTVEWKLV